MNIFYVHEDPYSAARMLVDKHICKMPLESAQMLCTAHRMLDNVDKVMDQDLYKATHKNHPSSIWARSSRENYEWLFEHFIGLCNEYTERYDKTHLSYTKFSKALSYAPKNISNNIFNEPPQCMPDYCKIEENSIEAYRKYYINEKNHIAHWKINSRKPDWWKYEDIL